jgi:hypothetical protein
LKLNYYKEEPNVTKLRMNLRKPRLILIKHLFLKKIMPLLKQLLLESNKNLEPSDSKSTGLKPMLSYKKKNSSKPFNLTRNV